MTLKITDQEFKERFSYVLNKTSNSTPTIITRKHNHSLVLLSLEDCKEIAKMLLSMQNYYDLVLDMQEKKSKNNICK